MNRSLLMLLSDDADHKPHMATKAIRDVGTLKRTLTGSSTAALDRARSNVPSSGSLKSGSKLAESDTPNSDPAPQVASAIDVIEVAQAVVVEANKTDPTPMP